MKEKTTKVLSIDWDYFVEEDPLLDWSHRETSLFLETIWSIRRSRVRFEDGKPIRESVDLTKELPFRGVEGSILQLPCLHGGYRVANAESHAAIVKFLEGQKNLEIVNIDAHHDIFYGDKAPTEPQKSNSPDCGSWGAHLMLQGRVKSYTQIYPEWRKKFRENFSKQLKFAKDNGVAARFLYGTPGNTVKWKNVDFVFACRSGCWTPPEYDKRFTLFCEYLGCDKTLPERKISELKFEETKTA